MKTSAVTPADLQRSVIAVPPLARRTDLELDAGENRRLLRHLEQGGVSTVLYGGNANIYNIGARQFRELFEALPTWLSEDTWIIPSIGPSYGQLLDHADVIRELDYPTAMALPAPGPSTPDGVAAGLRRAAERLGRPLVLYLKWEEYLPAKRAAELFDDGTIWAIKYAVVRHDPMDDPYLRELLDLVGAEVVVSGIGERPIVVHARDFRLSSFTSGSVCVAPRQSAALHHAVQLGRFEEAEGIRERFLALEDLRDGIHPIRVLHDAITEAGIGAMGPLLPLLSNLAPDERQRVGTAAHTLLAGERAPAN